MIIAIVHSLKFKSDPHTQTVYYNENCKQLEFDIHKDMSGNLKAVVAENEAEAVEHLRLIAQDYLKCCWIKSKIEDFQFSIRYSEVNNLGEFWMKPSIIPCKTYEVAEENQNGN